MYRDFCKYLDKRFVRTFKTIIVSKSPDYSIDESISQGFNPLETPLTKEASLNYVLRKTSELNLDLRAILLKNDENELSVISRGRFWRILEALPLGLLPFELDEIFDNDLNFDNYGNVLSTVIYS
jgi:hypothetical protein